MTAESKDPREQLNKIAQLLVEDLFNTPDADLMEEALQNEPLKQSGISAKETYQKAIQSVGAKRLQTARAEMKLENEKSKLDIHNIDALTARRIIARLNAANDPNLTLAARNLTKISDNEAIEFVKDLVELGAAQKEDES